MKRILLVGLAVLIMLGLLFGGCSSRETESYFPSEGAPAIPLDNTPPDSEPVFNNPPPEDMNWVSPGKVVVSNFYPGARAEYPVTIHNGSDYTATFTVSYRYPDHVGEGYVKPVSEVQDWVIITDATLVLGPRETKNALIVLDMPEDSNSFALKWEFWISVIDTSQLGTVRTELCVRWCINMRGG